MNDRNDRNDGGNGARRKEIMREKRKKSLDMIMLESEAPQTYQCFLGICFDVFPFFDSFVFNVDWIDF